MALRRRGRRGRRGRGRRGRRGRPQIIGGRLIGNSRSLGLVAT